jgi:uncharacterized protein with FMN-binding domain
MWVKLKRIVLSLSVIVLFALYALQKQTQPAGGGSMVAASLPTTTISVDQPTATSSPAFVPTRPTAPAPVQKVPTVSGFARATSTTPTATAPSPTVTAARTPTPDSAITTTTNGAYRDGSYTGIQADAHWGTVQVQAVIANGQIGDVQFTDYPNHRSRSVEINRRAMPILMREAIQSQQADVDIVSGATDTSEAFIQSLDSALRQAAS